MKRLRSTFPETSLLNPAFLYRSSAETDLAARFAAIRKEQAQIAKARDEQAARESRNKVSRLPVKVRG